MLFLSVLLSCNHNDIANDYDVYKGLIDGNIDLSYDAISIDRSVRVSVGYRVSSNGESVNIPTKIIPMLFGIDVPDISKNNYLNGIDPLTIRGMIDIIEKNNLTSLSYFENGRVVEYSGQDFKTQSFLLDLIKRPGPIPLFDTKSRPKYFIEKEKEEYLMYTAESPTERHPAVISTLPLAVYFDIAQSFWDSFPQESIYCVIWFVAEIKANHLQDIEMVSFNSYFNKDCLSFEEFIVNSLTKRLERESIVSKDGFTLFKIEIVPPPPGIYNRQ